MNSTKPKIIAFAATTSSTSINKQLVTYAGGLLDSAKVELLDLNNYPLPIYSEDLEKNSGIPQAAKDFLAKLQTADGFLISHAEHNGYFTAAYKNLLDWLSRIERKIFADKPTLLFSASPGANGGATALGHAVTSAPFLGANLIGQMALPNFYDNFDSTTGKIIAPDLQQQATELAAQLEQALQSNTPQETLQAVGV
ncbi:MAG: NAD(P)H-dependent oxidoreductase [Gammaproteobacteria bacterium]|nr:NAD(P)H-dependent oxidoreductase [Gammaproteobacteria bacterium]